MYFVLTTSTVTLAATHFLVAPAALTLIFPAVLCAISLARLVTWWKTRGREVPDAVAASKLRGTLVFAALLGAAFTVWALSLYPYGTIATQSHVAFYISVTAIACMTCLTHLRSAALLLSLVVLVPTAGFFILTGNPVFIAMSINLLLVAVALTIVLLTNYRHFANLIDTQQSLIAKQQETAELGAENLRLANVDALTNLPNRRRFFSELDDLVRQNKTGATGFTVGILDLDGFKPVNDLYGHTAGDHVLIEVGRRLAALCSSCAFLARLGGDEFAYIISGARTADQTRSFGLRVCEALKAPYVISDLTVQLSATVGYATCSETGADPAQLLEHADYALYEAKQSARGTAVMFSSDLQVRIRQHSLIEQGLRHPDIACELSQMYQPIFDVRAGRTIGFEALARWTNAALGVVPPDEFIQVAERTGLICQLTELLLRKALAEASHWPAEMRLSFNLSMLDIATADAVQRIAGIVAESGFAPGRIDFEITETAVMRDFEQACSALRYLRSLGMHVALDDFGSGYSSLSHVHRLPLDKIKIDRSFITELETEAACKNIVKSVIDLCRNLDLDCVVEGTETAGQLAILCQLGCSKMQGYFISRPLAADAIPAYLNNEATPRSRAV